MRFYIIFFTNVMSGLPLWCTDLRFGLPRASPPLQSPFHSSFSLLLDFLLPPLHFKVQSPTLSHSFWTSAHLPSTSKSILPLLLALFGLPRISPLLQSPFRHSFCTSQQKVDTTLYFYTSFNEHNIPYTVLESDNSESMPDVLH